MLTPMAHTPDGQEKLRAYCPVSWQTKMTTIRCFNLDISAKPAQGTSPTAPHDSAVDASGTHLQSEAESAGGKAIALMGERMAAAEAMTLLMRLDRELKEARADFNQDRFRRVMRARLKAVLRLQRRWEMIAARPTIALGNLSRRYHANIERYLRVPPT